MLNSSQNPDTHRLPHRGSHYTHPGFTLVEMVVVIAIMVILLGITAMYMSGGTEKARRAATDQVVGMVEQARNTALVSRSPVMLAIAEPGSLPTHQDKCVLGILRLEEDWDPQASGPVPAKLLGRWRPVETGVIFLDGEMVNLINPIDLPKLTIRYTTNRTIEADVQGVAFNARGRLIHPVGSAAGVLRLADGAYPGGVATPKRRGADQRISDTWLKIGRITGRAYEVVP